MTDEAQRISEAAGERRRAAVDELATLLGQLLPLADAHGVDVEAMQLFNERGLDSETTAAVRRLLKRLRRKVAQRGDDFKPANWFGRDRSPA